MNTLLKQSRLAVMVAFFINGALMATWVSRIPTIQADLSLSEGALGLVLLGLSAGVLTALSMAGGLLTRFGSAKVTAAGGIAMSLTIFPLGLVPNSMILWLNLFAFGAAMSIMDVAMNDQAVIVERSANRSLMSSFHATFSIGGMTGALIGSGMASTVFFSPFLHFLLVGIVLSIILLIASRYFLLTRKDESPENGAVFSFPERALWVLGAVAFCSSIAEGAMADWSGVYLNQILNTSAAFAALGYAVFSFTMTIGRLFGDSVLDRWNSVTVVRFGGLIASIGLVMVVLSKSPVITLVGFFVIGLGLSNIIPIVFSTAGNFPGISSGKGIAGVATLGYAGYLVGPPVIGLVAEGTSLRIAFALIAFLVGSLVFTTKAISKSG